MRQGVVSGVEIHVEMKDVLSDILLMVEVIASLIQDIGDLISSPPSEGRDMEKGGIGIYMGEPNDSGFDSPEIFLILEKTLIFTTKVILKLLEKATMVVVMGFLNSILPCKNFIHSLEDVPKNLSDSR